MVNPTPTARRYAVILFAVILIAAPDRPVFSGGPSRLSHLFESSGPLAGPGWVSEEDPFVVSDEAALSMVINGAAPRYMELGTMRAGFANYEKKGAFMMIEVYETRAPDNALALFREFAANRSAPLDDIGGTSRIVQELGGSLMLEFIRDAFYARLNITKNNSRARTDLLETAKALDQKIRDTAIIQ